MNTPAKIALAIFFAIGALVFGRQFFKAYNDFSSRAETRAEVDLLDNRPAASDAGVSTDNAASTDPVTNAVENATNAVASASSGVTNAVSDTASVTNAASNAPPTKVAAKTTNAPATKVAAKPAAKKGQGIGLYLALSFSCLVVAGLFTGSVVSNYFGQKTLKTIYNDEGDGMSDPEYDQAEQEWANGNHLEAIRLMREYLVKNPREQHAALRIAEIYEKDLKNYLAAALEYEEVLGKKLSPERWGWAAIHLCNLYYKLNKPDKAYVLLKKLDAEYGQTAAAEKARKRLALIEAGEGGTAASNEDPGQNA